MEKDMEYYIQVSGRIMKDNLDKRKSLTQKICDWYLDQDKEDICLIASGSSLNAAYAARPFLLKYSKFDISVLSTVEYLDVYREREKNRFTILISQSGCSTNIIEIMKELDKEHQPFVLLTGNENGSASRYTDRLVEYGVGNETIDYVTLGYSTLIEFLMLMILEIGFQKKEISDQEYETAVSQIRKACEMQELCLIQAKELVQKRYQDLLCMEKAILVGDGANLATVREGALKFQETLKVPTVYYESEEFIHGPDMQLTPDYSVFFIDCGKTSDRLYDIYKATSLITERCYMITDQVHDKRDGQIRIPCRLPVEITPLYTAALFQYIAAHVTKEKNNFTCHPLFSRMEQAVSPKTEDYDRIMKEKLERSCALNIRTRDSERIVPRNVESQHEPASFIPIIVHINRVDKRVDDTPLILNIFYITPLERFEPIHDSLLRQEGLFHFLPGNLPFEVSAFFFQLLKTFLRCWCDNALLYCGHEVLDSLIGLLQSFL